MCTGAELAAAAAAAAETGAAATPIVAASAVPAAEVAAVNALPALAEAAPVMTELPALSEAAAPMVADAATAAEAAPTISGAVEQQASAITDPWAQAFQQSAQPVAQQNAGPGLMNGIDAQELNAAHAMSGAQPQPFSIADTMSKMGDETVKALTDPKTLAGAGLSMAGSLWQQSALDAEQERLDKENKKILGEIAAEGDKMTRGLTDWGGRYLSADGMNARHSEAEADANKSMAEILGSAAPSDGSPVGKMSGDYIKDRADMMANAATGAADYARKLSKMVAPGLVNDRAQTELAQIGAANSSALSRIQGLGAIGRADQQNASPNPLGMVGGQLLQGAGNVVARK